MNIRAILKRTGIVSWVSQCSASLAQRPPLGSPSYRVHFTSMLCVALLSVNAHAQNRLSDKYSERQTFGREAFDKDNNIWVYSPKFAETFGMPPDYAQELKGFEAAAFRVQLMGYATCGYGGKAENCAPEKSA